MGMKSLRRVLLLLSDKSSVDLGLSFSRYFSCLMTILIPFGMICDSIYSKKLLFDFDLEQVRQFLFFSPLFIVQHGADRLVVGIVPIKVVK